MHDLPLIETDLVMQEWIWHLVSNTRSPFKTKNFGLTLGLYYV